MLRKPLPQLRYPILQRLNYSTGSPSSVISFFKIFPQNFPNGGPPADDFIIKLRLLRREYRLIQSEHHPDVAESDSDDHSSLVNSAYSTIKNPYTRLAHVIRLNHPDNIDITQDEVAKQQIAELQKNSPELSIEYKTMLMDVLEAHESLESAELESDLDTLSQENDMRLQQSEEKIDGILKKHNSDGHVQNLNWDEIVLEAIQLKYWVNIQNAIKDWEQGKPVHLTH